MVIALQQVSKRFGTRWALQRVNLQVAAGQTVLLTGHNGSGKTTLLRLLATAIAPTSGNVTLFEQSPHTDPIALRAVRTRLALLTHQSYLYEALTARENLAMVLQLRGAQVDQTAINAVLAEVDILPHADRSVQGFSAGMRRRVCLARLLLQQPELVLLDEPFAALDHAGMDVMLHTLRALQARGATIMISTHDTSRSEALCTMHVHLVGGEIQAC